VKVPIGIPIQESRPEGAFVSPVTATQDYRAGLSNLAPVGVVQCVAGTKMECQSTDRTPTHFSNPGTAWVASGLGSLESADLPDVKRSF
jgi:hypothetical protein